MKGREEERETRNRGAERSMHVNKAWMANTVCGRCEEAFVEEL